MMDDEEIIYSFFLYLSFYIDCDHFGREEISFLHFACSVVKRIPGTELVNQGMNEFQS